MGGTHIPFGPESRAFRTRSDILEGVDNDRYDQIDHPEVDDDSTDDEVYT